MLGVTAAPYVVCVLLSGLAPAIQSTRPDVSPALKNGRGGGPRRRAQHMLDCGTYKDDAGHHSASVQPRQLAAAQDSSLSPLMNKGSISLYSKIFTVAFSGALPCAIARNACSDRATIARARSFL